MRRRDGGGRSEDFAICYPRSELALRYGVGVDSETNSPDEAQSGLPEWRQGRPDDWAQLPWA